MLHTGTSLRFIEQSAQRILDTQPDATIRLRLLRDVLRRPAQDEALLNAQQDVRKSRWVQELVREQQNDSSWGRLHSRDSRAKTRIVTTEVGVERALALGLDATSPSLRNAARYLADLLEGKATRFAQIAPSATIAGRWASGSLLRRRWPEFSQTTLLWMTCRISGPPSHLEPSLPADTMPTRKSRPT